LCDRAAKSDNFIMGRQIHTVIYVTGLNDSNPSFQKFAVKSWRIYGVNPIFFQSKWASNETFQDKLKRLTDVIDQKNKEGSRVALFAVSAGASLAIAAFAERSNSSSAAFVCGKLHRPEAVGEKYYQQNPAFREAMEKLNTNVAKLNKAKKSNIISITPLFDEIVSVGDARLKGAKNVILPTLFHAFTIGLAISIFSCIPILFLKHAAKKGRIEI